MTAFRELRAGDTVTVRKPNGKSKDITIGSVGSRESPSCGRYIADVENHVFYENEGCTAELISRPNAVADRGLVVGAQRAELRGLRAELDAARATIAAFNTVIASNLREAASFLYEELAGHPQPTRDLARDLLLGEACKFDATREPTARENFSTSPSYQISNYGGTEPWTLTFPRHKFSRDFLTEDAATAFGNAILRDGGINEPRGRTVL